MTDSAEIFGIRKRNSLAFVEAVFGAYREARPFALLEDGAQLPDIPGWTHGDIIEPAEGGGWFEGGIFQSDSTQPAQIVFTSGTEGKPKAMVLSHRALSDTVSRLNAAMQVDASIREYVGVPVTYSFGLGRCRAVAAAGGKFFLPEKGFDPREIREMLRAGEINALSAVPALLRILLADPGMLDGQGARLEWLEIGSQYMSRAEKEQVKALFPNAVILQHYGLTEASRTTFLLVSETEGEALESVGKPWGEVEVGTSEDGRIRIRGPHLATSRIVDGVAEPVADADGWLTTGDKGHFESGMLYFDGRADDIINSGGIKVDPAQVEQEVLGALGLEGGIAIARIPDERRGEGFFVGVDRGAAVELTAVERAVHDALAHRDIAAGPSVKVQQVEAIPATATGKVQRKELAGLYVPQAVRSPAVASGVSGVRALYARMFERTDVPEDATFQDLGGDSLNYVEMSIALENELGALPADWDIMPVAQLAALEGKGEAKPSSLETSIFLRAVAITAVVAAHSGMHLIGGGTFLLFFLIGYNLARFKAGALIEGRVVSSLVAYTKVLIVPYFLLGLLFMAYRREFYPDLLLFYTNVVELRLTQIFPFWFVQVLIQCLLATGLLFLIPPIRDAAKRQPWGFALAVTVVLIAGWVLSRQVWDTDYLSNLVPQRYLALIWLGWCCFAANTPRRKVVALALGLGFALFDSGISRNAGWIALGVVAMLYVRAVPVPRFLRSGIQFVSAATFYIFALNGVFAWVLTIAFEKVLGFSPEPVVFVITFAGCLIGYWVIEKIFQYVASVKARARSLPTAQAA